jgi:hypothetical protein
MYAKRSPKRQRSLPGRAGWLYGPHDMPQMYIQSIHTGTPPWTFRNAPQSLPVSFNWDGPGGSTTGSPVASGLSLLA